MRPLRAILLDVDGTLLDSVDAHAEAWADALEEAGIAVSPTTIRPLVGMGGDKLLPAVSGISSTEERGRRISARRAQIFRNRYLPNLHPFPMVRPLLQSLHARGLRLVVATSASDEDLDGLLARSGVRDLIDEHASGDDVARSKPDPDIVAEALRAGRVEAAEALLIGDTPYDVAAAARAGVPCIGVRSGCWTDDGLAGAVAVYADAADLPAHLEESPIGVRSG
jgi:HAD superfamily hydrolase (TIGR01509 family)